MANKELFGSHQGRVRRGDTINDAGGLAYDMDNSEKLCQYVVTSTFGNAYYVSASEQLEKLKHVLNNVDPQLIAKAAVYGREKAKMKDTPAYLLAHLAAIGELGLFHEIFDRVVDSPKMLYNFVQIVRSGQTGRRSFGTSIKKRIQKWIVDRDPNKLFMASIGHSNPSLADIIRMVHPKPKNSDQATLFAYILGARINEEYPYDVVISTKNGDINVGTFEQLPQLVQDFEWFKYDNTRPIPDLDYRALANCDLTQKHWKQIALNMTWNTLRMNLNVLYRNGVFNDDKVVDAVARKLSDEQEVRRWNAFPYQILTAYSYTSKSMPKKITNALQKALDISMSNVPNFGNRVAIAVDVSGSMANPITGNRGWRSSSVSCMDVAALIASSLARVNTEADIVSFATYSRFIENFNSWDSLTTNINKLRLESRFCGHGTDASAAMKVINSKSYDLIVFVSDCQSWADSRHYCRSTGLMELFNKHKNSRVKLAEINLQPYGNTQGDTKNKRIMCIGGFSDAVFDVLADFANRDDNINFVDVIRRYN